MNLNTTATSNPHSNTAHSNGGATYRTVGRGIPAYLGGRPRARYQEAYQRHATISFAADAVAQTVQALPNAA